MTYIDCGGPRIAVPREEKAAGSHVRIQIHARDISIALNVHHDTSIINIVPAVISDIRDADQARLMVELELDDGQTLLSHTTRRSGLALELGVGELLYAQIKAVSLPR